MFQGTIRNLLFYLTKAFTNCKQRLFGYYIPMRLQPPPGVMGGAKPCNSKRGQLCKNDSVSSENNGSFLNVYSRLLFFVVEDVQIAAI